MGQISMTTRVSCNRTPLSLKGRGLAYLAQRDHSRVELKRKLMPHAHAQVVAENLSARLLPKMAATATEPDRVFDHESPAAGVDNTPTAAQRVDDVLDWLQARDYLSDARFAESRTHARSAKFGNLRIRLELAQHGVSLAPESVQRLKDSEFERARDLQARKFPHLPSSAAEHAKQSRFLAARGFSADSIRQVMRQVMRQVGWAVKQADSDEAEGG